jgi:LmbE family N-acetylglucosaminyl deacetylase
MRILAIGGHICDMEFSCGAVLAKHARMGDQVYLLSTTVGEKGGQFAENVPKYRKQKIEEGLRCAQKLGAVESRVLDYGDTELPCSREVQMEIAEEIRRIRPDVVITHWNKATHTDHYNTAINVEQAISLAGLAAIKTKYPEHGVGRIFYTDNWEDQVDFVPNVYISFTQEDMDTWQDAINEFAVGRGELFAFHFTEYYRHYAHLRGMEARMPYAQAFYTPIKKIKSDRLFTTCKPE